jgi:hypothetical protein
MSRAREFADLAGSADAGGLTGRNLIINGAMRVAQRQTSKQIVGSAANFVCDRFECSVASDATVTFSQDSDVPSGQGFTKSTKIVVNTADASLASTQHNLFQQKIEGNIGQHLRWGTSDAKACTVSFWIRSSLTGSFTYYAIDGNANSQSYVAPFTINAADTWEKKTITIPGPTTGGTTDFPQGTSRMLYTGFNLGVGSSHQTSTVNAWHDPSGDWAAARSSDVQLVGTANATMYVAGWQFEVGEQATPFEHRSFGDELARCQRYYQKSYDYGTAPGTGTNAGAYQFLRNGTLAREPNVRYAVEMRANPTETFYASDSGTSGKVRNRSTNADVTAVIGDSNTKGFNISMTVTSGQHYGFQYTADAEL